VVDVDERNRREYAQIVHDRPHSLPLIISESQTALDDFRNNLEKRLWDEKRVPAIRRLPRLILDVAAQDPQGRTVIVADFNYKYALVHGNWEPPVETELEIAPQTRLKLQLVEGQRKKPDKNGALYQVLNWAELLADQEFDSWLRKALQSSTSETSTLAVAPAFKIDINKPKLKVN
jgi:cellulose synthase (UDP-forming)